MTRLRQTRRELLKSGAAISAAVSFARYGITPSWSAAGVKKDGLNVVDEVLRQAADTKEVPGVVAVAANGDGVVYEGAFGKRDLAKGTDMTADFGVLDRVDDQGSHRNGGNAAGRAGQAPA